MKTSHKTIYGVEPYLAVPALALSAVSILCCVSAFFGLQLPEVLQKYLFFLNCAVCLALFLRMFFSRAHQYALDEMSAGMHSSRFKLFHLTHPEWGLWGSKMGKGILSWLRAPSMAVFILSMFVWDAKALPMLVALTGHALTILLTQAQAKDHYRLTDRVADGP